VVNGLAQRLARRWRAGLLAVVAWLALLVLDGVQRNAAPVPAQALLPAAPAAGPVALSLTAQGLLPMPPDTPAAHASSLLPLPATHPAAMMAFWFAGARESAPDVQIAQSQFDRASQSWTPARFVLNRHVAGEQLGLGLRRLGNPVVWRDARGRIHLFVVATGLGGWAAGRVVQLVQDEAPGRSGPDVLSFVPVRVLPLSWLWNTSFLARAAPLPLADGGMVLPVYFELGHKYPVALRLDAQGQWLGMTRISANTQLLQPTLLALDEAHWLALMRDNRLEGNVAVAQTQDGGQTWHDLPALALINPDASVAALTLNARQHLLAHNSSPASRRVLDLSQSANGRDWTRLHTLAQGDEGAEFSYPALAWGDGGLWVTYTDHRRAIAWQRFNAGAAP
jgi:predicted neuraminidase